MSEKHERFNIHITWRDLPEELRIHSLESSIYEGFYIHGAGRDTVQNITQFGFDERFSQSIYGDGL